MSVENLGETLAGGRETRIHLCGRFTIRLHGKRVSATCRGALAIGGAEIATAQRAARRLMELAPYRESGYRLLMQTLAAGDNVGEALLVYERLRCVMRDDLGAYPGTATQALHRQLLQGRPVAPPG